MVGGAGERLSTRERIKLAGGEGGCVGPKMGGLLNSARTSCEKAAHAVEGCEHAALAE